MAQFDGKPTKRELRNAAGAWSPAAHVRELAARPMCGVCGKPVERMTEEEDTWGECVVFTAWCHGQRDRVFAPAAMIKSISFGIAFAGSPRRLEGK